MNVFLLPASVATVALIVSIDIADIHRRYVLNCMRTNYRRSSILRGQMIWLASIHLIHFFDVCVMMFG